MKIKWYGHAYFRLEGSGVSIVTDPCDPEVSGLLPVREPADVVVMSSATDEYHFHASMVLGEHLVLNALEVVDEDAVEVSGVRFEDFRTMESVEHRQDLDENAMYRLELGGVSVLHLGDLGNPLSEEQLARLRGRVDVLLALTGGPPTIELDDLEQAVEDLGPRAVIPMHYAIPGLRVDGDILGLQAFTSRYPSEAVVDVDEAELELEPEMLPENLRVYILKPAN